jgi:hypothetical protein
VEEDGIDPDNMTYEVCLFCLPPLLSLSLSLLLLLLLLLPSSLFINIMGTH